MPRPPNSTIRHRVWFPVAMLLVLCGTVALAAFVRQVRTASPIIHLGITFDLGLLEVRLPTHWEYKRGLKLGFPPRPSIHGDEPGGAEARSIDVDQQLAVPNATIEKHLFANYGVRNFPTQPIRIAHQDGILMVVPAGKVQLDEPDGKSHVLAGVILRNQLAVVIRLHVPGSEPTAKDLALVRQIAEGIVVNESK